MSSMTSFVHGLGGHTQVSFAVFSTCRWFSCAWCLLFHLELFWTVCTCLSVTPSQGGGVNTRTCRAKFAYSVFMFSLPVSIQGFVDQTAWATLPDRAISMHPILGARPISEFTYKREHRFNEPIRRVPYPSDMQSWELAKLQALRLAQYTKVSSSLTTNAPEYYVAKGQQN